MNVNEAISVVRGRAPFPIIASDMEEAGNTLAAEVESLRAKLERMAADELAAEGHYQETIETLRTRLSRIETRAQQIRGGLKPYARPVEIVDYLMGEQP